jgi:hypothetical protein
MTTSIAFITDRTASRLRHGRPDVAGARERAPAMTVVVFDSAAGASRAAGVAFDVLRPWIARHRRARFVAGPRRMLGAEHDGRDMRLPLRGVAYRPRSDETSGPALIARILFGTLMVLASLTVVAIAPVAVGLTLALAGSIGLLALLRRRSVRIRSEPMPRRSPRGSDGRGHRASQAPSAG